MTDRIETAEDGMLRIIGKPPSPELLEQIAHRIGPDEAAVVISAEAVDAYLKQLEEHRK
ncbi:MAG TPA: hypothetical protein VFO41_03745 [Alphaproteobacteria bacterium]|nr:hypothetical protein [Alphaproteobacteria bacterium]